MSRVIIKIPDVCPECRIMMGDMKNDRIAFWIQRTDLDFHDDSLGRIEDQIYECSNCCTLFRAKWGLIEFVQLVEKSD